MTKPQKIRVDDKCYRVFIGDKDEAFLTTKEFDLLVALMKANGRVLSRPILAEMVWGLDASTNIQSRTIDQHIARLRKKVGPIIRTVQCRGYAYQGS